MSDVNRSRHRPFTVVLASVLLLICAACAVMIALLLFRQVKPFITAAGAVDPTGPDTSIYISEGRYGIRLIGISSLVTALVFVGMTAALLWPVRGSASAGPRRLVVIILAVLASAFPTYTALTGGIHFHIVAIPHEYNGDNAVFIRLAHSFQSSAVLLDAVTVILAVAAVLLLLAPPTSRYLARRQHEIPGGESLSSYVQRQQEPQPTQPDPLRRPARPSDEAYRRAPQPDQSASP